MDKHRTQMISQDGERRLFMESNLGQSLRRNLLKRSDESQALPEVFAVALKRWAKFTHKGGEENEQNNNYARVGFGFKPWFDCF